VPGLHAVSSAKKEARLPDIPVAGGELPHMAE
jgi:hypothetical protein